MPTDATVITTLNRHARRATEKSLNLDKRASQIIELGAGNPDDLLDDAQLAKWFGVSDQWPSQARIRGYSPPYLTLGPKRIRYRRDAVIEWLRSRPSYRATDDTPWRRSWNSKRKAEDAAPVADTNGSTTQNPSPAS